MHKTVIPLLCNPINLTTCIIAITGKNDNVRVHVPVAMETIIITQNVEMWSNSEYEIYFVIKICDDAEDDLEFFSTIQLKDKKQINSWIIFLRVALLATANTTPKFQTAFINKV